MATQVASLFATLGVDSSKLTQGLGAAKGELVKTSGLFGNLKGAAGNLGKQIPALGSAFALLTNPITLTVAGLAAFGKVAGESINLAKDMNETTSKVGVIFGNAAKDIEKFADTSDIAFGQTKKQAMDAASTFATFGKSAGLADKELVGFSTDLVGLSADLASFYNTSPEDAITAIGAALRGESEPIRRYGVLLDDATLRQKAMEMGIISTTKNALTPQQRVLAAYQVILAQTGDAQGDFARTSDGLANQEKILAAQSANLKTELGQGLLPVKLKIISALNKLITNTNDWGDVMEKVNKSVEYGATKQMSSWQKLKFRLKDLGEATALLEEQTIGYTNASEGAEQEEKNRRASVNNLSTAIKANVTATREMIPAAEEAFRVAKDNAQAARDYQFALEQNAAKLSEMEQFIGGSYGPTLRDHQQTQRGINQELRNEQANLDKLISQGYGPMSEKVIEARDRIGELNQRLSENEQTFDRTMKSMMFNLLSQQAATDGITATELEFLTKVATGWGLVDTATATATKNAGFALSELANGKSAQEVYAMLDKLYAMDGRTIKTSWDIQVATNYHGSIPGMQTAGNTASATVSGGNQRYNRNTGQMEAGGQSGLDMIVPPGYANDSFRVGTTSGERVIVIPKNMNFNMQAGPGVNAEALMRQFMGLLNKDMRQAVSAGRHYAGA